MLNTNKRTSLPTLAPDIHWCTSISERKHVQPRCPFTTAKVCPRFYQRLSLLGKVGSTQINPEQDEDLLQLWKKSDLWPLTMEYATSISGAEGNPRIFSNFCPEVTYDRFGYFASFLADADEVDTGVAHTKLREEGALPDDWRWYWASLSAMHYTECPIYSVLSHRAKLTSSSKTQSELPWYKKYLLELIIGLIIAVVGGLLLKIFG
jgi:hypothetical protein